MLLVCECGTVVPLLKNAAAALRRPSRAGVGKAPRAVIPMTINLEGAHRHKRCGKCNTGPRGSGSPSAIRRSRGAANQPHPTTSETFCLRRKMHFVKGAGIVNLISGALTCFGASDPPPLAPGGRGVRSQSIAKRWPRPGPQTDRGRRSNSSAPRGTGGKHKDSDVCKDGDRDGASQRQRQNTLTMSGHRHRPLAARAGPVDTPAPGTGLASSLCLTWGSISGPPALALGRSAFNLSFVGVLSMNVSEFARFYHMHDCDTPPPLLHFFIRPEWGLTRGKIILTTDRMGQDITSGVGEPGPCDKRAKSGDCLFISCKAEPRDRQGDRQGEGPGHGGSRPWGAS